MCQNTKSLILKGKLIKFSGIFVVMDKKRPKAGYLLMAVKEQRILTLN
jgi:hypothetical protein